MFKFIYKFLDWLFLTDELKELIKINELANLTYQALIENNLEALEIAKDIWENMECEYYEKERLYWDNTTRVGILILQSKLLENEICTYI